MSTLRVTMAVLVASVLVAPAATAAPEARAFEKYVALGDSYTAGPGIPSPRLDRLMCLTSTNNYPALLADNLGLRSYTDASCSGAETKHMLKAQPPLPLLPFGGNPPQFSFLRTDTDLVTIGIGGNDFDVFSDLTTMCPALQALDPAGSPCRTFYTAGGEDTMKQKVTKTGERVRAVLAGVHERSPDAKVLLVGYPRIAPPTGTCPDVLPFADGDLRWLDEVEQALNSALKSAAEADGNTTFVDMYPASLGHDACAGQDAWIQGKDSDISEAIQYHPFKSGMVGVANEISKVLGARTGTHKRDVPRSIDRAVVGDASTVTLLTRSRHGR
ncbi:SGNH/GDSL hydrolase family protein [Kibdelosporangium persicum]|uniref:Secreted hydrolase n=1 Tax=Kibdelosporangium persicum TaxID=2698649 RepID=A0ABX2FHH1_9PSEU|nr:SGNH/GDSL hydrolase family protein [Kibdelosporangium persicum]NRN70717.1 Secreted hydrolase [Kibdelosporangium persicum]